MVKNLDKKMTVGEVLAHHPRTRPVFERYGIDYCCGGGRILEAAVADKGLDIEVVMGSLAEAVEAPKGTEAPDADWTRTGLCDLVDHIEGRHHAYMKEHLPQLSALFGRVIQAHPRRGSVLVPLREVFELLKAEIEMHLLKEERILFPYIRSAEAHAEGRGPRPEFHCGSIERPIVQMRHEHDNAGEALARMRKITSDYALPEDACESFRALYDELAALEDDLHLHIHLENNILFPKAVEMCMSHVPDYE